MSEKTNKARVVIACKGADSLALKQLEPFQDNLKILTAANYNMLKDEIIRDGFSEPISVWKHKGKFFILNGHQRVDALTRMQKEGHVIPDLPVSYIEAQDIAQAKRKVLALTSQYGTMTKTGLIDFAKNSKIDLDEVKNCFVYPGINMEGLGTQKKETDAGKQTVPEIHEVVVTCESEAAQMKLYDSLKKEGYECRVLSM